MYNASSSYSFQPLLHSGGELHNWVAKKQSSFYKQTHPSAQHGHVVLRFRFRRWTLRHHQFDVGQSGHAPPPPPPAPHSTQSTYKPLISTRLIPRPAQVLVYLSFTKLHIMNAPWAWYGHHLFRNYLVFDQNMQ